VKHKYKRDLMFRMFTELFQSLPLGYILDGTVDGASGGKRAFIVHGGLFSKDGITINDLQRLNRRREPDDGLMAEMLWSDPQDAPGWGPSKRGIGVAFGPDVTHRFLDANGLDIVIRSHEMKDEGYEVGADGRLVTIFSAPNYCDQMGNKGAYISFDCTMKPKFTQFSAVPHPNVRAMAYAGGMMGLM
jgi:serine/threonine-protein phosphatase 5